MIPSSSVCTNIGNIREMKAIDPRYVPGRQRCVRKWQKRSERSVFTQYVKKWARGREWMWDDLKAEEDTLWSVWSDTSAGRRERDPLESASSWISLLSTKIRKVSVQPVLCTKSEQKAKILQKGTAIHMVTFNVWQTEEDMWKHI